MPRETIKVARGQDQGGIEYLAVLAYPDDEKKRLKFIEAAKAGMVGRRELLVRPVKTI